MAVFWLNSGPLSNARAEETRVASAAEIHAALDEAQPGDTLIMADGVWTDQVIEFAGRGTKDKPITLRAETPGNVILNGSSRLEISGRWLVVAGLRFEGGALKEDQHLVAFRGRLGNASHSRFTNSAILSYNPKQIDTRYFWVSIFGEHNRVDHNCFRHQNHSGVTVVVWRKPGVADHHRIDHNYFVDRPQGNANGWESVRIGTSADSLSDSFSVVEHNLFERTNGELEIISNKSGQNIYRHNTFRACAGTLTLRHGNHARVEGNFFLGEQTKLSGGIRIIGEGHTIINNYIANVDKRAGGAISVSAAVPSSRLNQYFQVKDVSITHNTVIHAAGALMTFDDGLGRSDRSLLARNVTVANNLFVSKGPTIFEGAEGADWTWRENIAYGGELGPKTGALGIAVIDPELVTARDDLQRPKSRKVGVVTATGGDFGAAPLTAEDVGPKWLSRR